MKSNTVKLYLSLGSFVVLQHCTPYVFAPPARMASLESAATLHKGEAAVQLEGGAHVGALLVPNDATFSGTARLKYGFTGRLDGSIEASFIRSINSIDEPFSARIPNVSHNLRIGIKQQLAKPIAITSGIGGGLSSDGGFVSPDFGIILAWENSYVVPFLSPRIGVSIPINLSPNFRSCAFAAATFGMRIPIGEKIGISKTPRWNILVGSGINFLWNTERSSMYWNYVSLGAEFIF